MSDKDLGLQETKRAATMPRIEMAHNEATIGGVTFRAVRVDRPQPHWRYKLDSGYVGHQGYVSRPRMWAHLHHAYSLRPDRWENDWSKALPQT